MTAYERVIYGEPTKEDLEWLALLDKWFHRVKLDTFRKAGMDAESTRELLGAMALVHRNEDLHGH
jgi:hypothetical protein